MKQALPLQLRPRNGEPGHGLLLRLGARSGRLDAYRFASFLGLDLRQILSGHDAERACDLSGVPRDEVLRWSPIIDARARAVRLCGQELADRDWSTRTRRYCPACIADDVALARTLELNPTWLIFHRSIWDVTAIQSCPVHGCRIADNCWKCGNLQGWRSTNMWRCSNCGADVTAAPLDPHDDPVGAYVVSRFDAVARPNEVLDPLPLRAALRLCLRLGQAKTLGAVHTLPRQDRHMAMAARTIGFHIAQDLSSRLSGVLDHILSMRPADVRAGLLGGYGWIYSEWLASSDPTAAVVRPIVHRHAVLNGLMSPDEARLGNDAPTTISATGIARSLGLGFERTRDLLDRAGAIPPGSRRGVAFTIDPGVVANLRATVSSGVSVKAAARHLQTGAKQISDLADAQLIERRRDGSMCLASLVMFERRMVESFSHSPLPQDAVRIGKAAGTNAVALREVCEAVLDGTMPAWGGNAPGFAGGAMVRPYDVRKLRRPQSDLSVERAAKLLGLHNDCVRALHRDGVISGPGARLDAKSISRFDREYVSGSRWARSAGVEPRATVRHLAKLGVVPAFELRAYRQAIYRISDLALTGSA